MPEMETSISPPDKKGREGGEARWHLRLPSSPGGKSRRERREKEGPACLPVCLSCRINGGTPSPLPPFPHLHMEKRDVVGRDRLVLIKGGVKGGRMWRDSFGSNLQHGGFFASVPFVKTVRLADA